MKERVVDEVELYLSDSCPRCSKKGFYSGGEFSLPPAAGADCFPSPKCTAGNPRGHGHQRTTKMSPGSGKVTHRSGMDAFGPAVAKK